MSGQATIFHTRGWSVLSDRFKGQIIAVWAYKNGTDPFAPKHEAGGEACPPIMCSTALKNIEGREFETAKKSGCTAFLVVGHFGKWRMERKTAERLLQSYVGKG